MLDSVKTLQNLLPRRHISLLLRASINPQRWKQLMCASPKITSVQFRQQQAGGMRRVNTGGVFPHLLPGPHMTGGGG